jgi:hypothetical protein
MTDMTITQNATLTTSDLLATTKKLQQSFVISSNNGKVTATYLGYMHRLVSDCDKIKQYKAQATTEADVYKLTNSVALCNDLGTLASNSSVLYTAAQPLLSATPKLKRYQKIPLVTNHIRQQQLKATDTAIQQVSDQVSAMEFPTHTLALLTTLQSEMKHAKGLAYFPTLNTFQNQFLAERQQYWTGYASLAQLTETLQSQLNGYCQSLHETNKNLGICPKS